MQLWLVFESKTQLEQHKAKKRVLYKVDDFASTQALLSAIKICLFPGKLGCNTLLYNSLLGLLLGSLSFCHEYWNWHDHPVIEHLISLAHMITIFRSFQIILHSSKAASFK